ncbi:hypothetical protein QQZ08_011933 [Neonectria magnoliae]|uniref:ABC transporter domain-containing protein n=1 Tax=Neonectria magnoliae TaxID=2732573 RepID=A0ABR1H6C2_9HYPO
MAADSAALTLMNSDIERVQSRFLPLHEYWANLVEVALACWTLQREIGRALVAPIVVILCVAGSAGVAGVTEHVNLPDESDGRASGRYGNLYGEYEGTTSKWRLMLVVATTLVFTPETFSPLMAFAVTSRTPGVTRIFPGMAYMTLLAISPSSLFQSIPNQISALAFLGRIEDFLNHDSRVDPRTPSSLRKRSIASFPACEVTQGRLGWVKASLTLKNIDLTIPTSSITIVVGPVASGKSTLLKALGEVTFYSGTVAITSNNRKIGHCDQNPFLPNGTIRSIIVDNSEFDATRYRQALEGAELLPDLAARLEGI